ISEMHKNRIGSRPLLYAGPVAAASLSLRCLRRPPTPRPWLEPENLDRACEWNEKGWLALASWPFDRPSFEEFCMPSQLSPAEALERLQEGNRRFSSGTRSLEVFV